MKKFFSILMVAMMAIGSVMAQDKLKFENVLNNRFGDNWEVSLAGGGVFSAYDGWGQGPFADNLGWTVEASTTKWFNPIFGTRVQVATGQLKALDENSWFITPHVDAVLNLSNWIGGYREDRVYYAKVFAGAGMHVVDMCDDAGYGAVGTAGLINTFRVSPRFDINLELKGYVMRGDDMQRIVAMDYGKVGQLYTATVGLTYRFGKRDWVEGVPYTTAENYLKMIETLNDDLSRERKHVGDLNNRLRKYDEALKALSKENKALADQIKNHKCEGARVVSTSVVYFDFDSYAITPNSEVALNMLAQVINNSPEDQKFTITGHADSQTGTNEYNLKLSEQRAKAVYDYLVERGVAKERLSYVGNGPTSAYHKSARANRIAYIK